MKVFKFSYKGHYFGGTCIVIAKNVDEAKVLLKDRLYFEDYESLELEEEYTIDGSPQLIHNDDGDF